MSTLDDSALWFISNASIQYHSRRKWALYVPRGEEECGGWGMGAWQGMRLEFASCHTPDICVVIDWNQSLTAAILWPFNCNHHPYQPYLPNAKIKRYWHSSQVIRLEGHITSSMVRQWRTVFGKQGVGDHEESGPFNTVDQVLMSCQIATTEICLCSTKNLH